MRVTSASASTSSLQASAASRTLWDPLRSEPGITRIFGSGIRRLFGRKTGTGFFGRLPDRNAYHGRGRTGSSPSPQRAQPSGSVLAIDPDPRGRDIHPNALGRFRADAV